MSRVVVAGRDEARAIAAPQITLAEVFKAAVHREYLDQPLHLGVVVIPIARLVRVRDDQHVVCSVNRPQLFIQQVRLRRFPPRDVIAFVGFEEDIVMAAVAELLRPLVAHVGHKAAVAVGLLGFAANLVPALFREKQIVARERSEIQISHVAGELVIARHSADAFFPAGMAVQFAPVNSLLRVAFDQHGIALAGEATVGARDIEFVTAFERDLHAVEFAGVLPRRDIDLAYGTAVQTDIEFAALEFGRIPVLVFDAQPHGERLVDGNDRRSDGVDEHGGVAKHRHCHARRRDHRAITREIRCDQKWEIIGVARRRAISGAAARSVADGDDDFVALLQRARRDAQRGQRNRAEDAAKDAIDRPRRGFGLRRSAFNFERNKTFRRRVCRLRARADVEEVDSQPQSCACWNLRRADRVFEHDGRELPGLQLVFVCADELAHLPALFFDERENPDPLLHRVFGLRVRAGHTDEGQLQILLRQKMTAIGQHIAPIAQGLAAFGIIGSRQRNRIDLRFQPGDAFGQARRLRAARRRIKKQPARRNYNRQQPMNPSA